MAFSGTKRFQLVSRLGEGGMGVVYSAYDRTRGMTVALKTLRKMDAANLYRFKHEFRALSDLSHPNIISLYELIADGDDWFFTMELVDGVDFLSYVAVERRSFDHDTIPNADEALAIGTSPSTATTRSLAGEPPESAAHTSPDLEGKGSMTESSLPTVTLQKADPGAGGDVPRNSGALLAAAATAMPPMRQALTNLVDLARLHSALAQLAHALSALHQVGMVHRDLKPSNVLVTKIGRIVLMDFGLVAALRQPFNHEERMILGTPRFMAPEQFQGAPPSEAADWYAFGVMLYMALTGHSPFEGSLAELTRAKLTRSPLPPSTWVEGVPDRLEHLCMRLLARDPAERPTSSEVLIALGAGYDRSLTTAETRSELVGRKDELARLRQAYYEAHAGATRWAVVEGRSGIGKTSLVERFLADLASAPEPPIVLSSRCHERESVVYKALDGAIDALSHYILRLPLAERRALAPPDIGIIARLFPTLARIPGYEPAQVYDPTSVRLLIQRAGAVIRELLGRLNASTPIVLRIEDLQWADPCSFDFLPELAEAPVPPRLLVIITRRLEDPLTNDGTIDPSIDASIEATLQRIGTCVPVMRMLLGPLSEREQRQLITNVSSDPQLAATLSAKAWPDTAGHPMLLTELARYLSEQPNALLTQAPPRLTDVIWRRVTSLPDPAKALLQALAVASVPMPLSVLAAVGDLSAHDSERAATICRLSQLARRAPGNEHLMAMYHDKVREAVLERTPPEELVLLNHRLAVALEAEGTVSPVVIAHHFAEAGELEKAAAYFLEAARAANEKLTINYAGHIYSAVLELAERAPKSRAWDIIRCRAWLGMAAGLRIVDNNEEALALLDQAEAVATAYALHDQLAELHYLRGSLFFLRSNIAGCLVEHDRALHYARMAGSPELEANALSGLGDGLYMAGRLLLAHDQYHSCIELCREHSLATIEAANLSMRSRMRYYQLDLDGALADVRRAVELADELGQRRADLVARAGFAVILMDTGDLDEAWAHCTHGLAVAQSLGARRFAAMLHAYRSRVAVLRGDADALALAEEAVALCRQDAFSICGPLALGILALATADTETRDRILEEGATALAGDNLSHNYFWFYRDAIEVSLSAGRPGEVERYARALEDYTRDESLPFSRFVAARGRLLARFQSGDRGPDTLRALRALYDEAQASRLYVPAQALGRALTQAGAL